MNRSEIVNGLIHHHSEFIRTLSSMPADELQRAVNGKWSPAELLDHIIKSVSPVRLAFSLPAFILKFKFGKANRPSRSFEELVQKYQAKLNAGGKAPGVFIPKRDGGSVKDQTSKLQHLVNSLCSKIGSYSEDQLDQYILPHPLLGKLTLREMLYFTMYHVQHHHRQIAGSKSV
jgi:hypothetical protein